MAWTTSGETGGTRKTVAPLRPQGCLYPEVSGWRAGLGERAVEGGRKNSDLMALYPASGQNMASQSDPVASAQLVSGRAVLEATSVSPRMPLSPNHHITRERTGPSVALFLGDVSRDLGDNERNLVNRNSEGLEREK